jgi:death-on-curing protein
MSKIFLPITTWDFYELLKIAQEYHAEKDEPIPEISNDHLPKIESCLQTPFQTFDGNELYRGFVYKASILFYLLIANHPLSNGNKRMAIMTLEYFCYKNGYFLHIHPKKIKRLAKSIAQPHDKDELMKTIKKIIRNDLITVRQLERKYLTKKQRINP